MPRYDYRCTSCGNTFEVSHGMREHPQIVCPDCGCEAQRIFDVSGIVLKGSGFYNTDQRGKKGATAATGGKDPESSTDSATEKAEGASKAGADATGGTSEKADAKKPDSPSKGATE